MREEGIELGIRYVLTAEVLGYVPYLASHRSIARPETS
jgi:hypothetical protein